MKKTILTGWNFLRVFRLFVGFFILSQGIQTAETFTIIMGIAFSAMAVMNVGCFGGNCAVPSNNASTTAAQSQLNDEVVFEEVNTK
jgi:arginine exporter protein ArgO|uniref:hypothetical protein n=1 Tax=Fluviicola sp. TaxID=1917219 RepID=UPI004049E499